MSHNEQTLADLVRLEQLEKKFYGAREGFDGNDGCEHNARFILYKFQPDYIWRAASTQGYSEKFELTPEEIQSIYTDLEVEGSSDESYKNLEILAAMSDKGLLTNVVRTNWNSSDEEDENSPDSYTTYHNIDSLLPQLGQIKHGILFRRVTTEDLQVDRELINAALSRKREGWDNIATSEWRPRMYTLHVMLNEVQEDVAVYEYPSRYAWREWYTYY
jgi:hypothetical protein